MDNPKIAISLTEAECIEVIKALHKASEGRGGESARATYTKICREYESYRRALKGESKPARTTG